MRAKEVPSVKPFPTSKEAMKIENQPLTKTAGRLAYRKTSNTAQMGTYKSDFRRAPAPAILLARQEREGETRT